MKTEFSAHAIQSIRKRNGAIVPFNPEKIARAIARAGEETTGIDLSGGYVDIPADWPQPPA